MKKYLPWIGIGLLIAVVWLIVAIFPYVLPLRGLKIWISTASGASFLTLVGLGLLLLLLMGLIAVYSKLGLASRESALGLPDGSIRGLLSLGLLVVFVTLSFFLYSQLSAVHVETQEGVSAEILKQIPEEQKLSHVEELTNGVSKNPRTYTVRRIIQPTKSGEDLAKQIFTTISNLLIAIAAFYFGSGAVSSATQAATAAAGGAAAAAGGAKPPAPIIQGPIQNKGTETALVLAIHGGNLQNVNKVTLEGGGKTYTASATSNQNLVTTTKFDVQPPADAAAVYTLVLWGPEGELVRSATPIKIPAPV